MVSEENSSKEMLVNDFNEITFTQFCRVLSSTVGKRLKKSGVKRNRESLKKFWDTFDNPEDPVVLTTGSLRSTVRVTDAKNLVEEISDRI